MEAARTRRRIGGLRASLVDDRRVAAAEPADDRASVFAAGADDTPGSTGRWLSSASASGAALLLEQLRLHSFAFVQWRRTGSDTSVHELFGTTALVFGNSQLHSQFYADPASDADQYEMKPGSSSRYVSFNRLREGVDYMFVRFDKADRMLPPRKVADSLSCQFEAQCQSMFRQFELLGSDMLTSLGQALELDDPRGLACLMERGPRSLQSSVEELAARGLVSAGEATNTSLFLLQYNSAENRGTHSDVDLLSIMAPETAPGLEVVDVATGRWVRPFETAAYKAARQLCPGENRSEIFCVCAGEVLSFVTGEIDRPGSGIPAAMHRGGMDMAAAAQNRLAMIGLIYAADDAVLDTTIFNHAGGRALEAGYFRDNVARNSGSYQRRLDEATRADSLM